MGKITQLADFDNQNHYKTVILKIKMNHYQLRIFKIEINSKPSDFENHFQNHFLIMSFYYIYKFDLSNF